MIPSPHVDYKHRRIKQYHKEGRALPTETTINNTHEFEIGRRPHNLPALQEVGFRADRPLLDLQRPSHHGWMGEDAFTNVHYPQVVDGQRAPALRFGDLRVLALLGAFLVFRLLPRGFSNRNLREHVAPLLGLAPEKFSAGRMTCNLRRRVSRG